MIKKNSRGFTLLELLVAIFIFTIVIFVGYKIIDKSTIAVKDQGNINKGQLTMNDMNNYITKDLEQSSSVIVDILLLDKNKNQEIKFNKSNDNLSIIDSEFKNFISELNKDNKIVYIYTIKSNSEINNNSGFDDKKIISQYRVSVTLENNKNIYSINRKDYNNTEIDFISKNKLKELNPPFTIKGSNPYEINMQYNGKNNRVVKHEFEVTSRYLISSSDNTGGSEPGEPIVPIPPKLDEIPEPCGFTDYVSIGYWTADESKCVNNNLYTWISYKNQKNYSYGLQGAERNIFDINANLSSNGKPGAADNSGKVTANIGDNINWKATADLQAIKAKDIDRIMIYVQAFTTLNYLRDDGETIVNLEKTGEGSGTIYKYSNGWNLYGGNDKNSGTWYKATLSGSKKENFNIYGKLSIDKAEISSGYALVVYGDSDGSITPPDTSGGDIVYEFIKPKQNEKNVYIKSYINVGSQNGTVSQYDNAQNGFRDISVMIKTLGNGIHVQNIGDRETIDEKFKDIKSVKISFTGDLRATNLNIFNNYIGNIGPNESRVFKLPIEKGQYHIKFDAQFDKLVENKPGRFIIDLIYN